MWEEAGDFTLICVRMCVYRIYCVCLGDWCVCGRCDGGRNGCCQCQFVCVCVCVCVCIFSFTTGTCMSMSASLRVCVCNVKAMCVCTTACVYVCNVKAVSVYRLLYEAPVRCHTIVNNKQQHPEECLDPPVLRKCLFLF